MGLDGSGPPVAQVMTVGAGAAPPWQGGGPRILLVVGSFRGATAMLCGGTALPTLNMLAL